MVDPSAIVAVGLPTKYQTESLSDPSFQRSFYCALDISFIMQLPEGEL